MQILTSSRILEGVGSSRKLVGIISTYPDTSPTPWRWAMVKTPGQVLLFRLQCLRHVLCLSFYLTYRSYISVFDRLFVSHTKGCSGSHHTNSLQYCFIGLGMVGTDHYRRASFEQTETAALPDGVPDTNADQKALQRFAQKKSLNNDDPYWTTVQAEWRPARKLLELVKAYQNQRKVLRSATVSR